MRKPIVRVAAPCEISVAALLLWITVVFAIPKPARAREDFRAGFCGDNNGLERLIGVAFNLDCIKARGEGARKGAPRFRRR